MFKNDFKTMVALSVQQPWAEMIVRGVKPLEIRTWKPAEKHIGKRILIHASKSNSEITDDVAREVVSYNLYRGFIIGSVLLTGYKKYEDMSQFVIDYEDHWNDVDWYRKGLFSFCFEDVHMFENPIPYKGQLNFFKVNPNDIRIPKIKV